VIGTWAVAAVGAGDVMLLCCGCVVVLVVAAGDAVGFLVGWCVLVWLGFTVCVLVEVGVCVGVVTAAQNAEAMPMVAACVPRPAAMWTRMKNTVLEPALLVT
jgi:hypothetical protein